MKWISLICKKDFDINLLKKIDYIGSVSAYDVKEIEGRFCVDYGDEHVFFDVINDCNDYEEELEKVPYFQPTIVMMSYTSIKIARNILIQADFPDDIYIDNDFGVVVPLKQFISMGMPMDNY